MPKFLTRFHCSITARFSLSRHHRRVLWCGATLLATTVQLPASPATAQGCPVVGQVLRDLTKQSRLPIPKVIEAPAGRPSSYTLGSSTLSLERCASRTVVAHEYGHYVIDLASGGSLTEFQRLSLGFTTGKNWLKSSQDLPGYERAAHCVGNVLGIPGGYTKCPHAHLSRYAREVVKLARAKTTGQP